MGLLHATKVTSATQQFPKWLRKKVRAGIVEFEGNSICVNDETQSSGTLGDYVVMDTYGDTRVLFKESYARQHPNNHQIDWHRDKQNYTKENKCKKY